MVKDVMWLLREGEDGNEQIGCVKKRAERVSQRSLTAGRALATAGNMGQQLLSKQAGRD
jgi:hypothetical protein